MIGLIFIFILVIFLSVGSKGYEDFKKSNNNNNYKQNINFNLHSAILGFISSFFVLIFLGFFKLAWMEAGVFYVVIILTLHSTISFLIRFKKRYIANIFLASLPFTIIYWFLINNYIFDFKWHY